MHEFFAIVYMVFLAILLIGLLAGENTKGVALALFILATMALVEAGSDGKYPLITFWAKGIRVFYEQLVK